MRIRASHSAERARCSGQRRPEAGPRAARYASTDMLRVLLAIGAVAALATGYALVPVCVPLSAEESFDALARAVAGRWPVDDVISGMISG